MHHPNCIRSDGDWHCARGCTHERDKERERTAYEHMVMKRVLTEIAQGHANHVAHAQSTLSSLNSEGTD